MSDETAALLFQSAKDAAKRAHGTAGTLQERLEAITTVILCVVVVETAINEIAEWLKVHRARPPFSIPNDLPYGFHDLPLRTKWSLLPVVIRQKSFDMSAEPWQNFEVLVELRNNLVHMQRRPLPKKVAGLLSTKLNGELDFKLAEWACNTVAAMFDKLTELLDLPETWINLIWLWTPTHSFPYGLSTPGDPWPRPP